MVHYVQKLILLNKSNYYLHSSPRNFIVCVLTANIEWKIIPRTNITIVVNTSGKLVKYAIIILERIVNI